jgi:hypothetical protein
MKYIKGDLLEGLGWDAAFHCANPHMVMGSGIAYFLRKKWPEVYQADLDFGEQYKGFEKCKLGLFSKAFIPEDRVVYNLYGQIGVGNDGSVLGRNCHYDHLYNAMFLACQDLSKFTDVTLNIAVPMGMASCRAGGSWIIVEAMLKDLETIFNIEFIVYEYGDETSAQSSVSIKQ